MDITKSWYIVFYAWDIGKEKLERKRVLHEEFSAIPDLETRSSFAASIIDEINYFLKHDWHLLGSPTPKVMEANFSGYSIIDALKYALKYKLEVEGVSRESVDKYGQVVETVKDFLLYKNLSVTYALKNLNAAFIDRYFEYIKTIRENSNKTHNDKRGVLHALINVLIGRNRKLFNGINPFGEVKILQTQTRKHAAFTDNQLRGLIDQAKKRKWFQIALFIQFMYYTLSRGKELAALKIGNIDLARRRILFQVDSAKTNFEDYVGISDRLVEIIKASGIMDYPQHFYVFSNSPDGSHQPGQTMVGKNYFYKRVSELIEAEGLYHINPNHTPYSVKHTGAIGLYLACRNINVVQRQCRHRILETTIKYLRDLGVFSDFDELNKLKGAI